MTDQPVASIIRRFLSIEDLRIDRHKKHQLSDIFFITLYATICGADYWVVIERFGKFNEQWFTKQLNLDHGILPHDTLGCNGQFCLYDHKLV